MWKLIVFGVGTIILIYVSRASLRVSRSHGFFRFFVWECILALFLINVDFWFQNPSSWHQVISWVLLFSSLVPLIFGVYTLRSQGKPVKNRANDSALYGFEKTSQLVTTGIYQYIRHPLYSSLLLLAWGIFFKQPGWISGPLIVAATFLLVATAKADENECTQFFGESYLEYMQHSKRFIPFVF